MTPHRLAPGFTLVELLVVLAIFTLITSVILSNHSRFNSSIALGSLAYDVALSIRQAQVYGLSVQAFNSGFQAGYGVHFSSPNSYTLFADANADNRYDTGDADLQTYSMGAGYLIQKFCGVDTYGSQYCSSGATNPLTSLDIVFFRPNPDANISSNLTNFSLQHPDFYSSATIDIVASSGESRTITVYSTGQVSVSPTNCQPGQCQ